MRYSEILNEAESGYYDPKEDKVTGHTIEADRKPRLSLKDINRLKKIRATKGLESAKKEDLLTVMYGTSAEEDSDF